ncbi:hypothetical protein NDU88_002370 [Pleurodeles waltl]|uniref:Uncharacterized protein n=1 Tax=Pleurodeles waltl TaxID=8319 RepID=A0AAV7T261_PLEWA|nr:hypothetical protein NDU88_002370 [Pleurodeles waltl]
MSRGPRLLAAVTPSSPVAFVGLREPLRRAPPFRRRSPAVGSSRLQPRSAAIRPLLSSWAAPGAGTHRNY